MPLNFPDNPNVNDNFAIGDTTWTWDGTVWKRTPGPYYTSTVVDAKGDLLVGTADNTIARLPVGTNDYLLTADSSATPGVAWKINSATSTGKATALAIIFS